MLWSPSGKATVLHDAGGRGVSAAYAINASGYSVGYSDTARVGHLEAVLWSPSGKATVLHDVGGQGYSYVSAINASGYSVGYSDTAGVGHQEAVLWSPSGKATDLGVVLGRAWSDTEAVGLNNSGDIIGYGDYHGGQYGFLLTPVSASPLSATAVPEVSTWAMLVVGFAGLGFAGYRRRK